MSDAAVRRLARRAGIAVEWIDHAGKRQRVSIEILRRILAPLGLRCSTRGETAASAHELRRLDGGEHAPPLVTATVGEAVTLSSTGKRPHRIRLVHEDGTVENISPRRHDGRLVLPPIASPGYHRIEIGDQTIGLAVAPARCHAIDDIAPQARPWGLAVQLYGLRRPGDGGIGDTGAVATLAEAAARLGADALALSPAHALFAADPRRYSPYAPSSRLFLNPLYADPTVLFGKDSVAGAVEKAGVGAQLRRLEAATLIDWPAAARAKMAVLRRLFDDVLPERDDNGAAPLVRDFAQFQKSGGDLLEQHARFEALHAARLAADRNAWNWRSWPAEYRDPASPAVADFAARHRRDILFHTFLQWIADRAFAAAQAHARGCGMKIGLIADLAVGMDSSGSHAWSRQRDLLVGLNVGAPPDAFNLRGQNWSLTAFSPRALVLGGFAPFIATLRAGMRHAGGVRIDHVMALRRLWLIPEGAAPHEGAYLRYPLDDLLRLVALESHRHRAIVIGEDLGTIPAGFRPRLTKTGIYGIRVLWFERPRGRFRPPQAWPIAVAAMTTTHDLPTVAGWWRGADIETRAELGLIKRGKLRAARERDRKALWSALRKAGVAADAPPPSKNPERAVDAAVGFVARTRARLALVPLEDALGRAEQPNVPGTVDEHPNWRRRLDRPVDELLTPQVRARLASLDRLRRR